MPRMTFDFTDKVALVTGSSQGIGALTALQFAEHGADVAIVSPDEENLRKKAEEIEAATGRRCLPIVADVTDAAEVEILIARTLEAFGKIDILVNNVGGSVRSPLSQLTPELWRRGIALNLDSTAYCTIAVGQHFREHSSGVIVNLSSVAGNVGTMGEVPYSAAKAGVQMFTKICAAEWGKHGIRVNCVAPGMTATEHMQAKFDSGFYDAKTIASQFPLRRPGKTQEVVAAILFLASEHASFITGQTLLVDGGPIMGGVTD